MYRNFFKNLIDIAVALSILILLSPVIIIISILVYYINGKPVLFRQKRPGKNAVIFTLYKFRTMTDKKDKSGYLLPDNERLTKFGLFLRRTSLDELPQIFNIIKGDLSLVGPRPLLKEYLLLYNNEQKKRHNVKPGMTGLAQINGRNSISWKQKFEFDVWYVEHLTFKLDLKILFLTFLKVLKQDGINKDGHVTTVAFNGMN
jgi:undecaprenyl phosphate N,N'-diacetylbacillosamine 1-phosphate transferase